MKWSVGVQTVTVTRYTGGSRVTDGYWDDGATSSFTIDATVNPVPGDVLLTLPEGERAEKQLRVLTETELYTYNEYDSREADHVTIRGEEYEVRDVQIYEKVIPHYEYRVRRIRPEPS